MSITNPLRRRTPEYSPRGGRSVQRLPTEPPDGSTTPAPVRHGEERANRPSPQGASRTALPPLAAATARAICLGTSSWSSQPLPTRFELSDRQLSRGQD